MIDINQIQEKYPDITDVMINHFTDRTVKHIKRVQDIMHVFALNYGGVNSFEIIERARKHGQSKYSDEEMIPYIYLTEFYRCKRLNIPYEYPEHIKEAVKNAINIHYKNNRHHPEYYDNLNEMVYLDLVEMVCDCHSISLEYNQTAEDTKKYIENNHYKEHVFNSKQVETIEFILSTLK